MRFVEIFINRPVSTTLITIAVVLAGVIAFFSLAVSPLPQIDSPTISVSAALPGADPETMATSVAAPLEKQFTRIAGVTEMTSASYRGTTSVTLQFALDRDINGAARDVQAAINAARSDLPANLPNNPTYRKSNPADAPILIIALTSDTVSRAHMYDIASSVLQQKISQIKGVGQVFTGGGALPAVRVDLNPTALNKYGVSLETVRAMLATTNVNRPKGQISEGGKVWEIMTNGQLHGAKEYLPLIISYKNGFTLRLSDVATVEDSVEDLRVAGMVNGRPAVMLVIFRQPGANIIETVHSIRGVMPQLEAILPGSVNLSVVLDRTPPITGSLRVVKHSLVLSGVLVILVVFWFIRSLRATLAPAVAVFVSITGTFAVMYLFGYSLNNLSLMALTVATGFVVDDAIVVLENISRYREKGMSPYEAAVKGSREIAFTVVSMSLSLVAVFIPILLMEGIVGRLFREFAVTLSASILISLAVSLTTTPMMCATVIKNEGTAKHGLPYRISEGFFNWMFRLYERSLNVALRHSFFMLCLTLLTAIMSVYLFVSIPKGFFPEQDTGRISGRIQAAQDISFQAMKGKLEQIVNIIKEDPDVEYVTGFTGGGGGGGSTTNTGRMFISLAPFEVRKSSAREVIKRLRKKLDSVPGAPTFLQPVQDIRIGGRIGGALYQYTLQGGDIPELNMWAQKMLQKLQHTPQIVDVNSDLQDNGRQVTLQIDRFSASRLGITPQMIDAVLYDAFGQRQVSVTYTALNQYRVVMEVAPEYWQHADTLNDIYVFTATGTRVPLSAFTRYEQSTSALAINHQGQFPSITISFNIPQGTALGEGVAAIERAAAEIGMPSSVRGSFSGSAQAFKASLANEPWLILAALVTVYIVLGILYESYIHPITILSTLPSAGVGAVSALLIFRTELSIIAIIGIILLIGIVKKNGIMMVDFALDTERRHGISPKDAIHEACLLRFRPIMMTTMAALLGALPLAVGTGVGSELRRPLGITIVGGLILSQILTLYTTPVIYLYMDRLRLRVLKFRNRRDFDGIAGLKALVLLASCVLLISCTAGKDYVRPSMEIPADYKEASPATVPVDNITNEAWWEVFNDPLLNELIKEAGISNQNIAVKEAQFRQARALVDSARSKLFPALSTGAVISRSRSSGSISTSTVPSAAWDYSLSGMASWDLDLWGSVRRAIEASQASAEASFADIEALRLSTQAEVATDYFQLRTLDTQRQILNDTIKAYEKTLEIIKNRYNNGVVSRADVLNAETQLNTTRAQSIDLGVQRSKLEHAIAMLLGKPASSFSIPFMPQLSAAPAIPAGVPSELLRRRADIAAAERRMAAANAQIGVALAAYFPSVTLSPSGGFDSATISKLLSWPGMVWSLGASIAGTIFDGGQRAALTEQARANYDATVATYRQTVLTAFQEVEDCLSTLETLALEQKAQNEAVKASEAASAIATNQYKAGIIGNLDMIVIQNIELNNRKTAADISGRLLTNSVLLIKALGGPWDANSSNANNL